METLNAILRAVFDAGLLPFRELPAWVGLAVVSLLTAVGMLLVFKATSDQEGIAAVKRRIHAGLFEIRLFKDDLRAIFRAQLDILRHNLTYLRYSLIPLLWMIVPLLLVIAQLQFHYGYRGLDPGEEALVKVELGPEWRERLASPAGDGTRPPIRLEAPAGISVETPGVWIPSLHEMVWRVRAGQQGDYELRVEMAGTSYTKTVRVTDAVVRRSPRRMASGFWSQLLYPAEPPLPGDAAIRAIALTYPAAAVSLLGWGTHWMVVFFILSIVFAFLLRSRFEVQI